MTRFEMEISGVLDIDCARRNHTSNNHYWENSAKKDVENAVNDANVNVIVDNYGAIMWKNNDNYLMDDLCEMLEYSGYSFDRFITRFKRKNRLQSIENIHIVIHKKNYMK